jgi:hypothetical protein
MWGASPNAAVSSSAAESGDPALQRRPGSFAELRVKIAPAASFRLGGTWRTFVPLESLANGWRHFRLYPGGRIGP